MKKKVDKIDSIFVIIAAFLLGLTLGLYLNKPEPFESTDTNQTEVLDSVSSRFRNNTKSKQTYAADETSRAKFYSNSENFRILQTKGKYVVQMRSMDNPDDWFNMTRDKGRVYKYKSLHQAKENAASRIRDYRLSLKYDTVFKVEIEDKQHK